MNTLKVKTGLDPGSPAGKGRSKQWMKDFKLVEWGPRGLFPEYLEMGKTCVCADVATKVMILLDI